jgi:hypothetical protein
MGFLEDKCTLRTLDNSILQSCAVFDCGHSDLNDFFHNDAILYNDQLLGKSYCFTLDEDNETIVCAFTVSNDSIKTSLLPGSRKSVVTKKIPRAKRFSSFPAVLIGRLGVNHSFKGKHIGVELMDFIKSWFIDENNKTGCRFIVVDSYNEDIPLKYYKRNSFGFLFSNENQEKEYMNRHKLTPLKTRLMYFDLIVLSGSSDN